MPFYYGYVMLVPVMAIQIASSPGQTFAFSAFTPSFREDLGIDDVRLTLAYALGTLLAAVPLMAIGPAVDRYGPRRVSIILIAVLAAASYAASAVNSWASLFATFLLLRFLGQGSMGMLAGHTLSMWFRRRVGRMGAVLAVGGALAFGMIPGLVKQSIADQGWRSTFQMMGIAVAAGALPLVVLMLRDRPEDVGQTLDGVTESSDSTNSHDAHKSKPGNAPEVSIPFAAAVRTAAFPIIGLISAAWAMIGTALVFYLYPIGQSLGLADATTNGLFAWFAVLMLVGQLAGGVAIDFVPPQRLLCGGVTMLTIGVAVLWAACAGVPPSNGLIVETTNPGGPVWGLSATAAMRCFAMAFGGGQGLLIAVTSAVWVKYYGRESLGKIRGAVWTATVAGSGTGPLLIGSWLQYRGDFATPIAAFAIGLAVMVPLSLWATRPRSCIFDA